MMSEILPRIAGWRSAWLILTSSSRGYACEENISIHTHENLHIYIRIRMHIGMYMTIYTHALYYITLHYITLHYITLHYITLLYIT